MGIAQRAPKLGTVVVVVTLLLAGAGYFAFSQAQSEQSELLSACASKNHLRLVDEPGDCKKKEQFVQWNVQGAPGADGVDGADGSDGQDGQPGADGINCWDLNGDGIQDPTEDTDGDGAIDVFDCRAVTPESSSGSLLTGNVREVIDTAGVEFVPPVGYWHINPGQLESERYGIAPVSGVASNLSVRIKQPSDESWIITLYVNGSPTDVTCAAAAFEATCNSGSATTSIPAHATVSLGVDYTGGGGPGFAFGWLWRES